MAGVEDQIRSLLASPDCGLDVDELAANFAELVSAAREQAPVLCSTWDGGVAALLRVAAAAPREAWLRSPAEPWQRQESNTSLLRRLLMQGDDQPDPLSALGALLRHLFCKYEDAPASVLAGGFTWSDGCGVAFEDGRGEAIVMCSSGGLRLAMRFARLYVDVALGQNTVAAAKQHLTSSLTKKMVQRFLASPHAPNGVPAPPLLQVPDSVHFQQSPEVRLAGPLARLRGAQVAALGGSARVAEAAVLGTRLGVGFGGSEEEAFGLGVLDWACRHADALGAGADLEAPGAAMEWLLSERAADPSFSLSLHGNPRSPRKVLEAAQRAAESLELRRLQTTGELFDSNPIGVKPFVKRNVDAAFDPHQVVPLSELYTPNSWHGDRYEPSAEEERLLMDEGAKRKATVRIEEILSFEYLQHVGQSLQNCLRLERRGGTSLFKYLSRARTRRSSFWVMTITPEDGEDVKDRHVEHLLLIEVFNDCRVVHQAEGPHPRRWPRRDAWAWLREWSEREGLSPDGPDGVSVGPSGWGWDAEDGWIEGDPWDIRNCYLW